MKDHTACFEKLMNNSDKFSFIVIGIALLFKTHFMHVLCSHMKNASLSKAKGGTKGERGI